MHKCTIGMGPCRDLAMRVAVGAYGRNPFMPPSFISTCGGSSACGSE